MPKRKEKITKTLCIVRTDAIGDFVLFTPSLKYVREKYIDFKITLVIQNRIEELVENCPCIDSIIFFNEKNIAVIYFINFTYFINYTGNTFQYA